METVEQDIEKLTRAVLSDAVEEAEEIMSTARSKAEGIMMTAQKQAADERKEILERAAQDAERIRGQIIATSQLKARTLQLERREKLLDNVFKEARKQLSTVPQLKDYDQIALNLLREALARLQATSALVQADEATRRSFTERALDEISREMKATLQFKEPLEHGIGVVVETTDGHLHYDNTLETRLGRLENALRSPVYHILMGESL